MDAADPTHDVAAQADPWAGLTFWLLVGLSFAGMAPCIILPLWREYQAAELACREVAGQVAVAEQRLAALERQLHGIQHDPAVTARMARRELAYYAQGDRHLPVDTARLTGGSPANPTTVLTPVAPPIWIARVLALLPQADYDRIFGPGPVRTRLLALSAALFVAAFLVFWPRRVTSRDALLPCDADDTHLPA